MTLVPAADADIPAIVDMMNRAYRGEGPERRWTTEAAYIDGTRTTEDLLCQDIAASPTATLLLRRGESGDLQGCVWLEPLGNDIWYLGSLTVEPTLQSAGLGAQLMAAAEDWIRTRGGREIKMTVVHIRDALIAWYERRGYRRTGETEPFPYGDARFGIPRRPDLYFAVLRKRFA